MTFLERYRAGEHARVWDQLRALGSAIRRADIFPDAYAVARETMQRARRNVETIVDRLDRLGYRFGWYPDGTELAYYVGPIAAPGPDVADQIAWLEDRAGPIPLSLRAFWETVGAVDLSGHYPSRPAYADPLIVYPPEVAIQEWIGWKEWCEEDGPDEAGPYRVPIAPDEYHKENVSGGAPYEIALPNAAVDAPLENEWHETTFVDYMRICFRWGGFPGLERTASPIPDELRALSRDLLAV